MNIPRRRDKPVYSLKQRLKALNAQFTMPIGEEACGRIEELEDSGDGMEFVLDECIRQLDHVGGHGYLIQDATALLRMWRETRGEG